MDDKDFQPINDALYASIKSDPAMCNQLERLMSEDMCDIDGEFLGFVNIYKHLADIIPKDRVIYDMGCAYAPQSYFFKNHRKYIGVDLWEGTRFSTNNTEHFVMSIKDFIDSHKIDDRHFAICSYVPPWGADNEKLVRDNFEHLFVFYPR